MNTIEVVLLIAAALAGIYAAFKNDAQVAGLGVVLVAIAVLVPFIR